jgi:DNA-binding IclR family transcriptional regulator
MPFMESVHDVLGHRVQLGVLDGDEVLFLERLSAPNAVINYTGSPGGCLCTPPRAASSSWLTVRRTSRNDCRRPAHRLHTGDPGHAYCPPATSTRTRRAGQSR